MQDAGKSMQAYRLKQQPFALAASVSLHWKLSGFKDHLGWFCNHFTYHTYMDINHVILEDLWACSSSLSDFNVRIHWNKKTSTLNSEVLHLVCARNKLKLSHYLTFFFHYFIIHFTNLDLRTKSKQIPLLEWFIDELVWSDSQVQLTDLKVVLPTTKAKTMDK